MKLRFIFLALLTLLFAVDRAAFVYQSLHYHDYGIRASIARDGLVITDVPRTDARGQTLPFHAAGVRVGDRLDALYNDRGEGGPMNSLADFGDRLRQIGDGRSCTAVIERLDADGRARKMTVEVPEPPHGQKTRGEWFIEFGFQLWVPMLAVLAAALIGLLRPRDGLAFLCSLMFFAFAGIFLEGTTRYPSPLREASLLLRDASRYSMGYLVLLFFLRFPQPSPLDRRARWLKKVAFAPALLFFVFGAARDLSAYISFDAFARVSAITAASGVRWLQQTVEFPLTAGLIFAGVVSLAGNTMTTPSATDRRRLHLLLFGAAFGLLPLFFLALLNYFGLPRPVWYLVLVMALVGLFPLSFIYAVARHRVFGIRLILRRSLRYALVSKGFFVVEGVVIFILLQQAVSPLLQRMTNLGGRLVPVAVALATLAAAVGIRQVNRAVLPLIDHWFLRDACDPQQLLTEVSRAARRLGSEPKELLDDTAGRLREALHARHVSVMVCEAVWPEPPGVSSPDPERRTGSGRPTTRPVDGARDPERDDRRYRLLLRRMDPAEGALARRLEGRDERMIVDDPLAVSSGDPPAPLQLDSHELTIRQRRDGAVPESWLVLYSSLETRLIVPLVASGKVLGLFCFGAKLSEEPYSAEELQLLATVAEQVAIALDYARLAQSTAEQETLRREMEIARDVQQQLLPREFPPLRTLAYTGSCRPALGVGGDYFDFLRLGEDRMAIALGDIAGKGLSAALLMASLQGALRSYAAVRGEDVLGLTKDVNRLMCETTDPGKFATFFYGVYDDSSRTLTYVNAGHPAPIVAHPDGDGGPASIERLDSTGLVLGIEPEAEYELRRVQLAPGDSVLIFSDGITEAEAPDGEFFDEPRLVELARTRAGDGERDLARAVDESLAQFVASAPQADDITTIVAQVR